MEVLVKLGEHSTLSNGSLLEMNENYETVRVIQTAADCDRRQTLFQRYHAEMPDGR